MLANALTTFHSNSGAWGLSGKRSRASLANFRDWGGSDAARSCNLAMSDASSRRSRAGGSGGFRGLGAAVGTGADKGSRGSRTASGGTEGVGSGIDGCVSDGADTVGFARLSSRAKTPNPIAIAIAAAPRTRRMAGLDTASWTADCSFANGPSEPHRFERVVYLRSGTKSRVMVCESVMPALTVDAAMVSYPAQTFHNTKGDAGNQVEGSAALDS
jgi:hypothetical protein